MTRARRADSFLWRALIASLALHAVVAVLIPVYGLHGTPSPVVQQLSFVRLAQIEILHPVATAAPSAAPQHITPIARPSLQPTAKPEHQQRARRERSARMLSKTIARSRRPAVTPRTAAAAAVPPAPAAQATPHPQASAATPAPAFVPTPSVIAEDAGMMPFGAEQSPVLAADAYAKLQQLLAGTHVTLKVTVDAEGHAREVRFTPPLDAATEAKVTALLEAAHWDAGVCGGGLTCRRVAAITL